MVSNNCIQVWPQPVNDTPTKLTTTNGISTVGNITYWPNTYQGSLSWPATQYVYVTQPPQVCSGDVHVFPCPHCDKCKCGAATVKRHKAK